MEVILIEKVEKLGEVGDFVKVKSGYARNFLLPQRKALRSTEENKTYYEAQKKEILAKNEEIKKAAKKVFDKINDKQVIIITNASDEGKLFGSIMPKDIASQIKESTGADIKKSQIILTKAIRETGVYEVKVRIHADYLAVVKVNVAKSEEDAKANLKPKRKPEAEILAEAAAAEAIAASEEAAPAEDVASDASDTTAEESEA